MKAKKDYIIVKDRHPRISEVLNDCISLCVPTCKNEPLSSILQKICAKLTTVISDVAILESEVEALQAVEIPESIRFGVSGEDDTGAEDRIFTTTEDFHILSSNPVGSGDIKFRNDYTPSSQFSQFIVGTSSIQMTIDETATGFPGEFSFNEIITSIHTKNLLVGKPDFLGDYISCDSVNRVYSFGSIGFGNELNLRIDDFTSNIITLGSTLYPSLYLDHTNSIFMLGDANGAGFSTRVRVSDVDSDISFNAAIIRCSLGLQDFPDDTTAGLGGIQVNQLYRNGSVVQIRVT